MTLSNGDLFVVQRGDQTFKVPSSVLKGSYSDTAVVYIGDDPQQNAIPGDLWWSSRDSNLYIMYNDGSSNQWVDASPSQVTIDYARLEAYIDNYVDTNSVSQVSGTDGIVVTPANGRGSVTVSSDSTYFDLDKALVAQNNATVDGSHANIKLDNGTDNYVRLATDSSDSSTINPGKTIALVEVSDYDVDTGKGSLARLESDGHLVLADTEGPYVAFSGRRRNENFGFAQIKLTPDGATIQEDRPVTAQDGTLTIQAGQVRIVDEDNPNGFILKEGGDGNGTGTIGTLQEVTDEGSNTTNSITFGPSNDTRIAINPDAEQASLDITSNGEGWIEIQIVDETRDIPVSAFTGDGLGFVKDRFVSKTFEAYDADGVDGNQSVGLILRNENDDTRASISVGGKFMLDGSDDVIVGSADDLVFTTDGVDLSDEKMRLDTSGNLDVSGEVTATKFIGDGSSLTNLPGANTPDLQEVTNEGNNTNNNIFIGNGNISLLSNGNAAFGGTVTASSFSGDGSGLTNLPGNSFSGNYNDLTNKPTIGNGVILFSDANGNDIGSFTVNQTGNQQISLPAGAKGDPGTAATIQVGSTTTGSAGSQASVTNVGNSTNAVFNFTIPRGQPGQPGQPDYNITLRKDLTSAQQMNGALRSLEEMAAIYFYASYSNKFGASEDMYTVYQGFGQNTSAFPAPISLYASGRAYFAAGVNGYSFNGREFTIDLERDNDSHYTTRSVIDNEGNEREERVYNGPVLNVKERILYLVDRLQTADNTIAQLQSELSQLRSDFETRLASLESDHTTLMNNNNNGGSSGGY